MRKLSLGEVKLTDLAIARAENSHLPDFKSKVHFTSSCHFKYEYDFPSINCGDCHQA